MIKFIVAFSLGVAAVLFVEMIQDFANDINFLRQRRQLASDIKTRREILTAHSEFMSLFDRTREERAIRLLEYRLEAMEDEE